MKKLSLIGSALFFTPFLAFAQTPTFNNVIATLENFLQVINVLLPIVIALALLYFFWGLAQFILASGNEDAKETGKRIMLWGVIAFFVMVSVWGLVNFLVGAFNLNTATPNLPQIPR